MMQQWAGCKEQAKEALLLFRLGDFYEAFGDDASKIAELLDLTLTRRQDIPMCGIPWHSAEGYIDRLVALGYSIAIADQIDNKTGIPSDQQKGLVERKIVRTITPGTAISSSLIKESSHHYIALILQEKGLWALSLLDLSTADFYTYQDTSHTIIQHELLRAQPKEILVPKNLFTSLSPFFEECKKHISFSLNTVENWRTDEKIAPQFLRQHFRVQTLSCYGLDRMPLAVCAASGLLSHVHEELLLAIHHIQSIQPLSTNDALYLDRSTITNLELFDVKSRSKQAQSLFSILNRSQTPMGARKIRSWLEKPSIDLNIIKERQESIQELVSAIKHSPAWADSIYQSLKSIKDLERIILRISTTSSHPKELLALSTSCSQSDQIRPKLQLFTSQLLTKAYQGMAPLEAVAASIQTALSDNPPLRISDGGVFRQGFNTELDELIAIKNDNESWLINYQNKLREELGIKTLKVSFSRAFGYFIEVSRGQSDKMPPQFARRQTLVNAERFISPELKEYEEKVLSAESKIKALEERLFLELKEEVVAYADSILRTASSIALFDSLFGLARLAIDRSYTCPVVHEGSSLFIKGGRHPVAETYTTQSFVPNDISLDSHDKSLVLITGPNMGGKSTYIRQVALLVIMAQIGSFIPAHEASISIVDKVFSRIGANDDLGAGQSTFMVEMAETASILNQATPQSLIILDEIGRGTSTYDGIAIAQAVAEYLTKDTKIRPKTLFATHYYELTDLETLYPSIKNASVAVYESGNEIKFLYKIIPGKADKSYGIHVAQLAGLPKDVLKRAKEILIELENSHHKTDIQEQDKNVLGAQSTLPIPDIEKTNDPTRDLVNPRALACLQFVESFDLANVTPLQCFSELLKLKNLIGE